jgi:hypothetical protein
MQRRFITILALVIVAGLGAGLIYLNDLARIPAGYKAKALCSEVFVAGRDWRRVLAGEFTGIDPSIDRTNAKIDRAAAQVETSLFGLGATTAQFRDGYGCTIIRGGAPAPLPKLNPAIEPQSWAKAPSADGANARIDDAALETALDQAMASDVANTRAILVAVDGAIVGERYRGGFDEQTPFLSWSMAKSVTASVVGAAVLRGYINLDDPAPVPEWRSGDPRTAITWNDLLRMHSGLTANEAYGDPTSDVPVMLYRMRESGALAAGKPLVHEPGEVWFYSSATTNLIARTLAQVLADEGEDYFNFARDALFAPLGAASFVLEVDSAGNSIGSSYIYATARDWARLGQLYLQGGVWNGERLLPEGWPDYVSTPTAASDGEYGAHFWLNRDGANGRERWVPGLPETVYSMSGHEGQYVFIIPDKNAVIVRTGMTREALPIEVVGPSIAAIYRAIAAPPPAQE